MDKLAGYFGEKLGDMVEDAVKGALGVGDKDKEEDKKGGFLSIFSRGNDDEEEEKKKKKKGGGGGFSFGGGNCDDDDDDGKVGFWDKLRGKDDDECSDGEEKRRGFEGMWREPGADGMGGAMGGACGDSGPTGGGPSCGGNSDLFNDLMDVANDNAKK